MTVGVIAAGFSPFFSHLVKGLPFLIFGQLGEFFARERGQRHIFIPDLPDLLLLVW